MLPEVTGSMYGLEENRPDIEPSGVLYRCTDVPVVYVSTGSGWLVVTSDYQSDKAAFGPFANNVGFYCAASAAAAPTGGSGTSGCVVWYQGLNPTAPELLLDFRTGAATRGWFVGLGYVVGDRGIVSIGQTPDVCSDVANTITGSLGVNHAISWAYTGGNLRTSFNGGAVRTTAMPGPYVPRIAGDRLCLGLCVVPAGNAFISGYLIAVKSFSTVVADADLVTLSGATTKTNYRIPTPTGATIDFNFNAAWYREGETVYYINGERFRNGASASPVYGTLKTRF